MSIVRADSLKDRSGAGAPNAPNGLTVAGVCTATTFSGSGASLTSLPAGNLTGTVADARISTLTASKLTGALPAISGANLTNVIAGKMLQVVQEYDSSFPRAQTNSTTFVATTFKVTITPTEASSKILIDFRFISNNNGHGQDGYMAVRRSINGGSFDEFTPAGSGLASGNKHITRNYGSNSRNEISTSFQFLDSPSYSLGNAIEYKMYVRSGNASHYFEVPSSPNYTPVLCFATEIAA